MKKSLFYLAIGVVSLIVFTCSCFEDCSKIETPEQTKQQQGTQYEHSEPIPENPYIWTKGRVYFAYNTEPEEEVQNHIEQGMDEWMKVCNVRFIKAENPDECKNLLTIIVDDYNGLTTIGKQEDAVMYYKGKMSVLGELGRVLGLGYEHTRVDRDNHIIVNWDNIMDDKKELYETEETKPFPSNMFAYDLNSVMHFNQFVNCKNGQPTMNIRGWNGGFRILGSTRGLSYTDTEKGVYLYGRPNNDICEGTFCQGK
jgi:hypothetical protein